MNPESFHRQKMKSVLLSLYFIFRPAQELFFAIYDNFYYYRKDFILYTIILCKIVINFIWHCILFFKTHMFHLQHLHELGFHKCEELYDSGSLIWTVTADNNTVNSKNGLRKTWGLRNNKSGNPMHLPISSTAMKMVWNEFKFNKDMKDIAVNDNFSSFVFIDFGCGTGYALLCAMQQCFIKTVIGVDLDDQSVIYAKNNVYKFLRDDKPNSTSDGSNNDRRTSFDAKYNIYLTPPSNVNNNDDSNGTHTNTIKCHDVELYCQNMTDYVFPTTAANEPQNIILFMYEPLWTLPKSEAYEIYKKVIHNAVQAIYTNDDDGDNTNTLPIISTTMKTNSADVISTTNATIIHTKSTRSNTSATTITTSTATEVMSSIHNTQEILATPLSPSSARILTTKTLYIVYFYVGTLYGDALPVLSELCVTHNAELMVKKKYPSLFFGVENDMYIYKITNNNNNNSNNK